MPHYYLEFAHRHGVSTQVVEMDVQPTEEQLHKFWTATDGHDPNNNNEYLDCYETRILNQDAFFKRIGE